MKGFVTLHFKVSLGITQYIPFWVAQASHDFSWFGDMGLLTKIIDKRPSFE